MHYRQRRCDVCSNVAKVCRNSFLWGILNRLKTRDCDVENFFKWIMLYVLILLSVGATFKELITCEILIYSYLSQE